jgi:hypothetical protein
MSLRETWMWPSMSNMCTCSTLRPSSRYRFTQAMAAAPAPSTTTFTWVISFPASSSAFSRAAEEMMAVPCWSSCITGMFSSLTRRCSISKDSGAFTSSMLMPPKVGSRALATATNSSTVLARISMSKTSIPANFLKSTAFPSITGLAASGPMLPRPSTAVPLVSTATRLSLMV